MHRRLSILAALLALGASASAQDPQVYTSGASGKSITQANTAVSFTNNVTGGDSAAFLARSIKVTSRAASANTCYLTVSSTTAATTDIPLAPGGSITFDRIYGYSPESGWAGMGAICSTGQTATFDIVASRAQLGAVGGILTTPALGKAQDCAAPPYSFVDDADTGICTSAANVLQLRTGGTNRAQIDSSGVTTSAATITTAGLTTANVGTLVLTAKAFSALGTPSAGTVYYCNDCTANSNPCTGSGTGAIAKRLNSAWDCR